MKEEHKAQEVRLKEIQASTLAGLSDDAILELLAERKHLENVVAEYQKQETESAQKHDNLVKEEHLVEEKIAHLNEEIRPDKKDEELIALIQERKLLEEELLHIEQELGSPLPSPEIKKATPIKKEVESPKQEVEVVPAISPLPQEIKEVVEEPKPLFKEAGFGDQGIQLDGLQESGDFEKYVHQLEASRDSLGGFLQSLPRVARVNKSFMLRVASIDPAYAMHYAVDGLRRDENFHIQIASIRNTRGSGNALAEMDVEMRTGQVVLAATRQDFRNVRFVGKDMPEYDEIIKVAKKSALEKIQEFKEAVDVTVFIPKILQQDEIFMASVQTVLDKNQHN
jgi:hypothetical protein